MILLAYAVCLALVLLSMDVACSPAYPVPTSPVPTPAYAARLALAPMPTPRKRRAAITRQHARCYRYRLGTQYVAGADMRPFPQSDWARLAAPFD